MHDSPDVVSPCPIRQQARLRRFEAVRRVHRAGELFREGGERPRVSGRIERRGRMLAVALQTRRDGRAGPHAGVEAGGFLALPSGGPLCLRVERASACIVHRGVVQQLVHQLYMESVWSTWDCSHGVDPGEDRKKNNYERGRKRPSTPTRD